MAKQKSKHTEVQLSGLYSYINGKECPSCSSKNLRVIESRKTFDGTRRRYLCTACGHRQTMHEIPAETYEEFRKIRSKLEVIRDAVFEIPVKPTTPSTQPVPQLMSQPDEIPCVACVHLKSYGCSFDIPEAQTEDAKYCNLFQGCV